VPNSGSCRPSRAPGSFAPLTRSPAPLAAAGATALLSVILEVVVDAGGDFWNRDRRESQARRTRAEEQDRRVQVEKEPEARIARLEADQSADPDCELRLVQQGKQPRSRTGVADQGKLRGTERTLTQAC
jgi:hypothetical protein